MCDFSKYIGIPFVDGGRTMNSFDCWGLAKYIFENEFKVKLPDYKVACEDESRIDCTIESEKRLWEEIKTPVAPSLVVMRFNSTFCNHLGVYIGNGKFIHTAQKMGVNIDSVDHIYWKRHIVGYYIPKGGV